MKFFDTTNHKTFDKKMNPKSDKKSDESQLYYREFFEQSSEGIYRIAFDEPIDLSASIEAQCDDFYRHGFIAEFNNSFAKDFKSFNANDLAGLRLSELKTGFEILSLSNTGVFFKKDLRLNEVETQETGQNGKRRFFVNSLVGVVENGKLVCVWGRKNDITTQKLTRQTSADYEKYFQQTQKIEALGRLAGGIAHDFNNFLAVMVLQNDMLNLQLPANSPLRHRTEEMKKATGNAAAMVKQLLVIGRKQTLNPKPIAVNDVVNEFSKILPTIISQNIEIQINLETDSGVCFIDPNQLIQTLINLTLNSQEAMPEGGILKIETANIVLDKNSVQHKSQPEGSFVQIKVSDNGVGMDSSTLESVFEPFFSTKKSSKGVGLGLATTYGFVKQSKGFIWVESESGQGTAFKIQFPRIDQPIPAEKI